VAGSAEQGGGDVASSHGKIVGKQAVDSLSKMARQQEEVESSKENSNVER
jgi:hypothetical protein